MPNKYGLLDENEVIDAVATELERRRFRNIRTLTTKQRGVDIKATYPDKRGELWVEAKGATSADPASRQYPRLSGFEGSQKRDHMANATYVALRYLSQENGPRGVGIAVPAEHRDACVNPVLPTLMKLGVIVFLVARNCTVDILGKLE